MLVTRPLPTPCWRSLRRSPRTPSQLGRGYPDPQTSPHRCLQQCAAPCLSMPVAPRSFVLLYQLYKLCGDATVYNEPTLVGAVVQLVEYRTRNQEVAGSTHTRSTEATLSKLLTYCVLRPTQPPTFSGIGNE